MFKNATIYKLAQFSKLNNTEDLADTLKAFALPPALSTEMQQIGWIGEPHVVGDLAQFKLRIRSKLLPASVIALYARQRALEAEEQQGYKPGRKQMREIKEQVTDELLPKAFEQERDVSVLVDLNRRFLYIDSATSSVCDIVLGLLAKTFDPFPIESLYVATSPVAAMTQWAIDDEAPDNFTIDQDMLFEAAGDSGAKIAYTRLSVDAEQVRQHLSAGRQVTRLALTWADRVSFVLDESLTLRRITPLDVIKEGLEADDADASLLLYGNELGKLVQDLVAAHGGEKVAP